MCFSGVSSALQHVELLLREVADRQALALGHAAGQRAAVARGDGLHQRRLALAVGAEDADALAGQHASALTLRTMIALVAVAARRRRRSASIGFGRLAGSRNSNVKSLRSAPAPASPCAPAP